MPGDAPVRGEGQQAAALDAYRPLIQDKMELPAQHHLSIARIARYIGEARVLQRDKHMAEDAPDRSMALHAVEGITEACVFGVELRQAIQAAGRQCLVPVDQGIRLLHARSPSFTSKGRSRR